MENKGFEPGELPSTSQLPKHSNSASKRKRASSVAIQNEQITFSWDGITVQTSPPTTNCFGFQKKPLPIPKKILKHVSGFVKPGELVAIMGASGAGKSTLLNTLTYRNLTGLEVTAGTRYANGVVVTPNALTAVSGYVQQDDLFIGTLSVREQLEFQALVRMETHIPKPQRMERVDAVIQDLGLAACQNSLIGIPGRLDGISGGEMKRLAFACEVLTNPSLLFCDEPTSGLDSYMAQNVVEVLRDLAQNGKTIVCTIHQPSSQLFALFDRILLMAEGQLAFLGDMEKADLFFERMGYPCSKNYNPADHYVHVLAVTPGREEECRERVKQICEAFRVSADGKAVIQEVEHQKTNVGAIPNRGEAGQTSPYRASWGDQFRALLWRSWLSVLKEPTVMQVRFFQTLLISLVLGLIYLNQDYSQEGVMNINGALFLLLTNMTFMNLFAVMNVFSLELPIFLREHLNGMYRVDVYYICKQLAELPVFLMSPIIFVSIYYWMVGLNPAFDRFLIAVAVSVLLSQSVVSFGYFISCISPNLSVALALAPPLIIPIMLFGGFFLNFEAIPSWLAWFQYLSWFKYGNEVLVINQWRGVDLQCNSSISQCNFETGQDIIDFYNFKEEHFGFDIAMLVLMAILFRVLGFFALLARSYQKQH